MGVRVVSRRHYSRAPRRPRAGFTLVEVLIATIVLTMGVLALAGSTSFMLRSMGSGAQQALAANAAQSRIELLRAGPCPAAGSDSEVVRGVTGRWTVANVTRGRSVVYTAQFAGASGTSTRSFRSVIPC